MDNKEKAFRAGVLNRYYTAMLQASVMGLVEFLDFDIVEIKEMIDDMFKQLEEATNHYEEVLENLEMRKV